MALRDLLYRAYERRLAGDVGGPAAGGPHHVGVILDGNRRWARQSGLASHHGHRRGADKIIDFLGWCEDAGVGVVTLYLLSTDNLRRDPDEVAELLGIIEDAVLGLVRTGRWRVHPIGALHLLPAETAERLTAVAASTRDGGGLHVNVAIGYGGRQEIADAVRSLLLQTAEQGGTLEGLADVVTVDSIAEHLYTKGQPDPDLVIRTSGEQRLSGFLLWQSAHSEFYFCEALWPDFRRVDLLRALRAYAARERRYGS
ncbi:isoprenyl transferase [Pseudokineococcus basanitobsidens]|uniref:Isoprenyl transferase n=1 Tax=Pseudokineococcus basanitobsidens TaxID=1926649 RepID=A0ABU8RMH9_9ACTN